MNKQQQNCKKKEDILNFPLYMYIQDNLEEWFHDFTKEMIERQIS